MKLLKQIRGSLIRGVRWPLTAVLRSRAGRKLFRGLLLIVGSPTSQELHDEALSWLIRRIRSDRGQRLALRLRRGARDLRYTPGILQTDGIDSDPNRNVTRTLVVSHRSSSPTATISKSSAGAVICSSTSRRATSGRGITGPTAGCPIYRVESTDSCKPGILTGFCYWTAPKVTNYDATASGRP